VLDPKSSTKPCTLVFASAAFVSGIAVAPGWLAGRAAARLMARLAAKCFFTPIFLIRLIPSPIVPLSALNGTHLKLRLEGPRREEAF
jgi:hypothetical protein